MIASMAAKPKFKQPARRLAPSQEQEDAALEYHEASEALRKDEVRRSKAKARCIQVGVLPDYERDPFDAGTVSIVYDGRVRIVMTVVTALERFDHQAFVGDLAKLGINARQLARLVRKHTTTLRPAHVFKTSLAT
jgi:hypothetical protein